MKRLPWFLPSAADWLPTHRQIAGPELFEFAHPTKFTAFTASLTVKLLVLCLQLCTLLAELSLQLVMLALQLLESLHTPLHWGWQAIHKLLHADRLMARIGYRERPPSLWPRMWKHAKMLHMAQSITQQCASSKSASLTSGDLSRPSAASFCCRTNAKISRSLYEGLFPINNNEGAFLANVGDG